MTDQRTGNLPTDRHWCTVETDRLPEVIKALADFYWGRLESLGLLALWRMSDRAYYGTDPAGKWAASAAVSFGGEEGELVIPRLNHYRSITQAIMATATAERPDFQAQSVNDQTQSLIEAPIATGVIKAFWRQHGLEQLRQRDVERALLYGKGFMHLRWAIHAGEPVMVPQPAPPMPPQPNWMQPPQPGPGEQPPTPGKPKMVQKQDQNGVPMRQGDVIPASCSPVSVIHEIDTQGRKLDWAIVAHREDAYELAARYPQFERELRDAIGRPRWPERVWSNANDETVEKGDTKITVWCLYHPKTSAVPNGRYAIVAADRVLYDGPALMADDVPVYPIIPMLHLDTSEGHSACWDLLNIQELFDAGASAIATGHDAFGVKNIMSPNGSGVSSEDIRGGLRVIPYEPGPNGEKPEELRIEAVSDGAYKYQDWLEKQAETISGVNATARGNPGPQVKSGSFAALMDSKATHFQSAVQRAVVQHDEDIAGGYLKLLKAVGGLTRLAEIAGRSGSRLKKVSPEEIETIERVTVEQVNPTLSQPGVRWELVQSLLKAGVITEPKAALTIFTTGKLEPTFRAPEAQLDLINGENDMLAEGILPAVVYMQPPGPLAPQGTPPEPRTCEETDDHAAHIREHGALLDIATRRDPEKVKVIKKHMTDHAAVAGVMSAQLAALTGQSVAVGAPPPPPDAPKPGQDGLKKPEKDGPSAPRAEPGGGPSGPTQPLMPQNPSTGERAQP